MKFIEEIEDRPWTCAIRSGGISPTEALIEAEVRIRQLERGGTLADLHARAVPELSEYDDAFAVHDPDSRARSAGRVRASVRRGLHVLENTDGFAGLIPAVGSNLVEALPDAETVEDVAAVPGRILAVRGRATVPGDPEFGVSQHVAGLVLAARRADSDTRAALNLRYEAETVDALGSAGLTTAAFDPEADLGAAVGDALATTPAADVLYQTGAMGIEPIIYVLGPDAPTVARRVRDLARG